MSRRHAQAGFSLLEILVAFSILALSLGVLLEIFSTALRGVALSEHYTKAALLAESRLADLGADIALESGSFSSGEEEGYRWEVSVSPYAGGDLETGPGYLEPLAVKVLVSWGELGRERRIQVETLRLSAEPLM
jgi:general secretion pathway protein I